MADEIATRKAAVDAMLRADGRSDRSPLPTPPGARSLPVRPAEELASGRTIIGALAEMQARDFKDYSELIQSLRDFAGQKRADLEHFERLLGNVERSQRPQT